MRPAIASMLVVVASGAGASPPDFLIDPTPYEAEVRRTDRELVLENGLVRRTWRLEPDGACIAYDDLVSDRSLLRSVRPEARITIDGTPIDVGGLLGQPNHAFLTPDWLDDMTANPEAMHLVQIVVGEPVARFAWNRRRHAAPDATWPPKGVAVRMDYARSDHDDSHAASSVTV
ncbi:MAG: hypothetical protein KDA28_15370, partial [Phycisphaerales bacterium]|nr:hypothetical protein [Phycisphaerales bacterium]